MECVTSPSYSITYLNGSLYGKFAGKKGLRQGDPLSPFLFVLCLEYFSRLINLAANRDRFAYHPKCAKLNITHLAFADDLMLFSKGDCNSVGVLLDCLNKFSRCSGLRANLNKSGCIRVLWNIHDKRDSLWIGWVDQVYLNGASVWDWTPAKGDLPSSSASLKFGTSLSIKKGLPSLLLQTLIGGSQGKILQLLESI
ncbi:hypothetical protein DH2020_003587 [Rehmannia glutinosa]|uniref:Reverse transcriptase domain-containing protein n=1 Tax=Rehmannia glutinosa TaxID=99300 RepID=A0ABR0XM17_REHGL